MVGTVQFALAFQLVGVCLAAEPIAIVFDFKTQPEPAVVDRMKSEIREILSPADMDLSFRRLDDGFISRAYRKIVIVRFQGACQSQVDMSGIQLSEPGLLDYPALGRTAISEGHILPFVQVFCNEVRAFLPFISDRTFAQIYGRALGRVVAHELYHALLSTRDHSRTGVARFSQSARDLTRDKLPLDAHSIARLRHLYGPKEKEGDSEEPPSHIQQTLASRQ